MNVPRVLRLLTSVIVVVVLLVAGMTLVGASDEPNIEIPAGFSGHYLQFQKTAEVIEVIRGAASTQR